MTNKKYQEEIIPEIINTVPVQNKESILEHILHLQSDLINVKDQLTSQSLVIDVIKKQAETLVCDLVTLNKT